VNSFARDMTPRSISPAREGLARYATSVLSMSTCFRLQFGLAPRREHPGLACLAQAGKYALHGKR